MFSLPIKDAFVEMERHKEPGGSASREWSPWMRVMQLLYILEHCHRTSPPGVVLLPGSRLWSPSPKSWNAVTKRMSAGITLPAVLQEEGCRLTTESKAAVGAGGMQQRCRLQIRPTSATCKCGSDRYAIRCVIPIDRCFYQIEATHPFGVLYRSLLRSRHLQPQDTVAGMGGRHERRHATGLTTPC